MNTFEDPGFDASDVVAVKPTLSDFEEKVRLEVVLFYALFNKVAPMFDLEPQVFEDDAAMFKAYWARTLG